MCVCAMVVKDARSRLFVDFDYVGELMCGCIYVEYMH